MSRLVPVWLCAMVAFVALIGAPLLRSGAVFAASGTLSMETPLHDSPDPAAPVIALLPEWTVVSIDGPPVDGFYPVTAENLSGWMRGETLQVEKDIAESDDAEETAVDPPIDQTDETVPVEAPTELNPTTGATPAPTVDPASDPEVDPSAAPEASPPVADSAPEEETVPIGEPVPVEELAPANESAPVDDAAAASPAPDPMSPGDAISELTAPDGAASPPDSAANATEGAAAPTMDPNVTPIPVTEIAPVGPASVTADAPILLGPGPDHGVIATAPAGSMVEKTGHVIDGYVTVQYAEVTGWIALGTLGVPSTGVFEAPPAGTSPGETAALVEPPMADGPPNEAAPAELVPAEALPAETPLAETLPETSTAENPSAEPAPVELAPVDAEPVESAPVDASSGEATPVGAT